jgi:3-phenylpropionate/cinnamic acid dioxygenase small subunit
VDVLAEFGRQALNVYERTQHVITNLLITLDGDRARVRANLIAVHVARASEPTVHFDTGCRYEFETSRTPQGWRISSLKLEALWTAGADDGDRIVPVDG